MTAKIANPTALTRSLSVRSKSFDEAANTVDIVYSTGAAVDRGGYIEKLVISEDAIDATRIDAGAVHLICDHKHEGPPIGRVIGHRIEGEEAIFVVQLAEGEDRAGIVTDIKAGVIRSVSVGYSVLEWDDATDDAGIVTRTATRWLPWEVSLTVIPADYVSYIRSNGAPLRRTEKTKQDKQMPKFNKRAAEDAVDAAVKAIEDETGETVTEEDLAVVTAEAVKAVEAETGETLTEEQLAEVAEVAEVAVATQEDEDEVDAEAVTTAERTRAGDILALAARFNAPATLVARSITEGLSAEDFKSAAMDAKAKRTAKKMPARATVLIDEREKFVARAENAVISRMTRTEPTADARELRNLSMVELARQFVGDNGSLSRQAAVSAALSQRSGFHTTSDFAHVLGNAGARTVRRSYDAVKRTYLPFVNETDLPDFRSVERVSLGDAPKLMKTAEGAEITYGTMGDSAEIYKLAKYTRAIGISREALVNDDLGVFQKTAAAFGVSAGTTESDAVYGIFTGNPKMSDGNALFSAKHNNVIAEPLTVAGLSVAKSTLRKQKSAEGNAMDIYAAFLIVGPDLEFEAFKMVSPVTAALAGDVNPHASTLQVIVDNRITGTEWFLSCSPDGFDVIETGYLDGARGVQVETFDAPDRDGVKIIAKLDFAAAPIDWRGLVKSTGQ
jgi:phage head maturation protease